jgi:hypothetical protein
MEKVRNFLNDTKNQVIEIAVEWIETQVNYLQLIDEGLDLNVRATEQVVI